MSDIVFEWDPVKSRANKAKHGVLFGISIASRVLVVCHCYRRADEVIRIISARRATASERLDYARFLA